MKLLLDTHVLLWALSDDHALGSDARKAVVEGLNMVHVSSASVWEIAIKRQLGKLDCPGDLINQIAIHRFDFLAISAEHAWAAALLPPVHKDPFDRMLVAQAALESLTLVTADRLLTGYGIDILQA